MPTRRFFDVDGPMIVVQKGTYARVFFDLMLKGELLDELEVNMGAKLLLKHKSSMKGVNVFAIDVGSTGMVQMTILIGGKRCAVVLLLLLQSSIQQEGIPCLERNMKGLLI